MQYKNNNGYIARKLENQSKKVREIFKQLDREWVLELFTKAQNEKWILGYLCLEYYKITNDLIFKTKLDKYGINDSNPTGNTIKGKKINHLKRVFIGFMKVFYTSNSNRGCRSKQ
jgi:hypothetical protein